MNVESNYDDMKIEIKEVVDHLSTALGLRDGYKVGMYIDDAGHIVKWAIVKVEEDGTLIPQWDTPNLKELLQHYL